MDRRVTFMKIVKNALMVGGLMSMAAIGLILTNKNARKKAEKMLDTMLDEAQDAMQNMS